MSEISEFEVIGTLHADGGADVVRMVAQFRTMIDDHWSALTEPHRLAHWYGDFDGDFRVGGTFRASIARSG